MLTIAITAIVLLLISALAMYLLGSAYDWHAISEQLHPDQRRTFWQHVLADLGARRQALVMRWAHRLGTWARTWWWLLASALAAFVLATVIGGTDYVLAWAGTLAKACSGAVIGFLVLRFLLRLNVSEIAAKYPTGSEAQADAAGKAVIGICILVSACVLAIANGV